MDELRLRRGQEPDHRIREKPGLAFGYVQPTAGGCITSPDSPWLRQIVLGAALVSIVFVPLPCCRDTCRTAYPASTPASGR